MFCSDYITGMENYIQVRIRVVNKHLLYITNMIYIILSW